MQVWGGSQCCARVFLLLVISLATALGDLQVTVFGKGPTLHRVPHRVDVLDTLTIVQLVSGDQHILILTATGQVWSYGTNQYGQLGTGSDTVGIGEPGDPRQVMMPNGESAVKVAAGKFHSLIVDSEGGIWSFGLNKNGQLGLDDFSHRAAPERVKELNNHIIVSAACGDWHSFALTGDGRLFSWGRSTRGQLGVGETLSAIDQKLPVPVDTLSNEELSEVVAGEDHSMAITRTGSLFVWGDNGYGQLGHVLPNNATHTSLPVSLDLKSGDVEGIASGQYHSMALLKGGQVKVWGRCDSGQLGVECGSDVKSFGMFNPINFYIENAKVTHIAAGAKHSVAVTSTNDMYVTGDNSYGQLGILHVVQLNKPTMLPELSDGNLFDVAAGPLLTIALVKDPCSNMLCNNPPWPHCYEGLCANGECHYTIQEDGTPCDDDNACTTGDVCTFGQCSGKTNTFCDLPPVCHRAVCDPKTGMCMDIPLMDGSVCSDTEAVCYNGTCTAEYPYHKPDDGGGKNVTVPEPAKTSYWDNPVTQVSLIVAGVLFLPVCGGVVWCCSNYHYKRGVRAAGGEGKSGGGNKKSQRELLLEHMGGRELDQLSQHELEKIVESGLMEDPEKSRELITLVARLKTQSNLHRALLDQEKLEHKQHVQELRRELAGLNRELGRENSPHPEDLEQLRDQIHRKRVMLEAQQSSHRPFMSLSAGGSFGGNSPSANTHNARMQQSPPRIMSPMTSNLASSPFSAASPSASSSSAMTFSPSTKLQSHSRENNSSNNATSPQLLRNSTRDLLNMLDEMEGADKSYKKASIHPRYSPTRASPSLNTHSLNTHGRSISPPSRGFVPISLSGPTTSIHTRSPTAGVGERNSPPRRMGSGSPGRRPRSPRPVGS